MFSILSWNINGFRSANNGGHLQAIWSKNYDYICFQEIKLSDVEALKRIVPPEYYIHTNLATAKGRNGVAVLCKEKSNTVKYSIGHERFDQQGRYLEIDFGRFVLINLYMPHGGRDKAQLSYKLEVAEILEKRLTQLSKQRVIIATDFNIAHSEIDLCKSKNNYNNIMFTENERKIIDTLESIGYIDAFRKLYPDKVAYTWWSYAFECRKRNIGWRIDYFFISQILRKQIIEIDILKEHTGSDHCPILMLLEEL